MIRVKKCVSISPEMWRFVRENSISLSKFLQNKLRDEMEKRK